MNVTSLQAIMLSIAQARALDPILGEIVRGVAEGFDLVLARLWLLQKDRECPLCSQENDKAGDELALHLRGSVLRARDGRVDNETRGRSHRVALGERKIGQIARTGTPMLIPSLTGSEPWVADPQWVRSEEIRSFAGQPLIFHGETLGVLAAFSRSVLTPEEFGWLRTFADHAAVAIANAKAFEELARLKQQLEAENEYLHDEIRETLHFGEIIGESGALRKVMEQVSLVADTTATVLLQGESGTGKELIARAIHERSARCARPFVKVNCGAIPPDLFESEFFGHVKGAFTGAIKDRLGRFELAHTGDLFLDEVAEIPLGLQAKLLRVLQEKQFERVGEARTRTVDVRVIGATNRDLKQAVAEGRFREDLYYRLSVFPIELPPLRERKEDIPRLAQHFLHRSAARLGIAAPRVSRDEMQQLQKYDWPGNIRELENVIERATILAKHSGRLRFELTGSPRRKSSSGRGPSLALDRVLTKRELRAREVENIMAALAQADGKVFGPGGAAEILGMRPTTLASRIRALGLKKTYVSPDQPHSESGHERDGKTQGGSN